MFVPDHGGVRDNERVDRLEGLAMTSEGQPLDHADIVNNLRDIRRVVDFGGSTSNINIRAV